MTLQALIVFGGLCVVLLVLFFPLYVLNLT